MHFNQVLAVTGISLLLIFVSIGLSNQNPAPTGSIDMGRGRQLRAFELDTSALHALYLDGEFDSAIVQLESARKNGRIKTHADSVFLYKHLGVMYTATYATMEKGKQCMYQLLTIEPSVRIMDMYASDIIYMIFRNVQTEFEIRHARPKNKNQDLATAEDTIPGKPTISVSGNRRWPYWTAASITLATGIGVVLYFNLHENPATASHYDGGL